MSVRTQLRPEVASPRVRWHDASPPGRKTVRRRVIDAPVAPPDALIVDDEPNVRAALRLGLENAGLSVREAPEGLAALAEVRRSVPDVAVLDVSMPKLNGIDLVSRIRAAGLDFPICMVSARDDIADRVAGLAAGADDYVVKPFSIGELAARLHALVRLDRVRARLPLTAGDVAIDIASRTATLGDRTLELTFREFELLLAFVRHSNQVLSRGQLLAQVWGYTSEVDSNVVDVFVGYLRRKLESDGAPRVIETIRGVGFILRA